MRREYRIRRSSRNWEKSLVDSRWSLVVSVSDVCQRLCSASIDSMATITIRQLDEKTKTRLRVRAAHHGRSMEEEAREILRSALTSSSPIRGNLAEAVHRRFAAFGGVEFESPRREAMRQVANLANDHPRYQCALGAYEAQALFSSCGMGCQTTSNRTFYNINHRGGNLLLRECDQPSSPRAMLKTSRIVALTLSTPRMAREPISVVVRSDGRDARRSIV
jgi:antitoxin FitA